MINALGNGRDMKKLSVIVPVYNADKYLERCIESIRRSYDCENMELILINDGSTDKSSDICDTYRKYPDVVVFHKENGGVASARNLGIDNAKGEFITFCDADDWVSEEILSSVSLMEQHNYDLEVSGYMKCWTDGKNEVVHLSQEGDFEHLPAEYFISGHLHPCWGKIYKKSIIDQYHIRFPKHSLSEDSLFNIEYLEKCEKIYLSKRSYYHYLQDNSESLTKRINLDAFEIYILLQKIGTLFSY